MNEAKVNIGQLNEVQIKAMIYDEQTRVLVAQNNIKALQEELLRRLKAAEATNMVEEKPKAEVVEADPPKEGE